MLCLFEVEVFGMVSFAIEISVSMKYFIWSLLFGSCTNFLLERVWNSSKFALLVFQ